MKLYAISDLHLSYPENRDALATIPYYPEDWLIIAGDIGESEAHFHYAFSILSKRFATLIWTPGNHDLWCHPLANGLRGEEKYQNLVRICHEYGVITPDEPYPEWRGEGISCYLAPLFLLYDYSFRPPEVAYDEALHWAHDSGLMCKDEFYLNPRPYLSVPHWCNERYNYTYAKLQALPRDKPMILINHYPLHAEPLNYVLSILHYEGVE